MGARNGRKLAGSSILASALVLTVFAVAATAGPAVAGGPGSKQFSLSTVSPVAQSTVAGNVVWEVAYTGATPDKMTFYVDGALKWTEYAAPFRFNGDTGTLDTSTLSTGRHTLKAVGYRSGRTAHTTSPVSVSSSASGQVPTSTASPAISGAALAGSALTASTGAWSGSPTSYAYKWQRCDNGGAGCQPIAGAASQEYLLVGDDVGRTVRVSVTATNGSGASPPADSAATGVVRADLALGQPASTSSNESGSYSSGMANDGNSSTRWSSSFADNQWWQVDLGSVVQVDTVSLNWEAAYASSYRIQVSTDGWNFVDAATVSNSAAGWKTTTFAPVSAHYVRVLGITRATVYGFSFWDARVFGPGGSSTGDVLLNTSAPTVAGVVATDQTLTASVGSWTGAAPMSYAYRWLRCSSGTNLSDCSTITGATYSVYTVGVADVGAYLRVSVVASNSAGSASGVSAATAQVVSAPVMPGTFDPRFAWLKAPWNADASGASADPNSAGLISTWVARGNIHYPNVCTNGWSAAWKAGTASDPKYNVTQTTYPGPLDGQIPIPRGTLASPDADHHLVMFDPARNRVSEFWQAAYDATTDSWIAGSGVSFDIGGNPPKGSGSNAAGFPQLALAIWPEEIQAGVINHALAFSVLKAAPTYRFPATHTDGQGDRSDLPEGSWLALPTSLTPNPGWPAWVKVVFTALQQHGMFLMDQGGTLGIAGVNPVNGGVKWSDVGMGTGASAGFPSDFPWSSMRVMNPPSA